MKLLVSVAVACQLAILLPAAMGQKRGRPREAAPSNLQAARERRPLGRKSHRA